MKRTLLIILTLLFALCSHVYAGQATLSWTAPTTNVDGTPLTDLAGYKVYYGTSSRGYTTVLNVNNVTTYILTSLTDGTTYFFAATAYDTTNNESAYSNEVSKLIGSGSKPVNITSITIHPN